MTSLQGSIAVVPNRFRDTVRLTDRGVGGWGLLRAWARVQLVKFRSSAGRGLGTTALYDSHDFASF